jgi:hypothetical protein
MQSHADEPGTVGSGSIRFMFPLHDYPFIVRGAQPGSSMA